MAALAVVTLAVLAPDVRAITIIKPKTVRSDTAGPESATEENQQENALVGNSGHFAWAAGTTQQYNWSTVPNGLANWDLSIHPQNHMVRFILKPGVATTYSTIKIRVDDTGDSTYHEVSIVPCALSWNDNWTAGEPPVHVANDDRVVHIDDGNASTQNPSGQRVVQFTAKGIGGSIPEVRIRTHKNTKQGQQGTGQIDILAYDGNGNHIQKLSATEWKITVPVTTSAAGAIHSLTFKGDVVSAFKDDIEVDIIVHQELSFSSFDGIGAVMDYTVCEIDLEVNELDEEAEEDPGEYVYTEGGEPPAEHTYVTAVIAAVSPDDMTEYSIKLEALHADTPPIAFEDGSGSFASPKIISVGTLPYTFEIHADDDSDSDADTDVRIMLVGAGNAEVGGESCRDVAKMTSVEITIINPEAAPLTEPADANGAGNEFQYDTQATGEMEIPCRVTALPNTVNVRSELEGNIQFSMQTSIAGSTLTWSESSGGQGVCEYDAGGNYWEVTATYTTLPALNGQFGLKTARLHLLDPNDSEEFATQDRNYEVFFDRDANNNPGGSDPNWFYYWSQVHVNNDVVYNSAYGGYACTPGMTEWSYTSEPDKTAIWIGTSMPAAFRSYGVGEYLSGIDRFVGSVIHEERHVEQIAEADALLPVEEGTCFQYGWCWITGTHNHWDQGDDEKWGVAEEDDDANSIVDDAAPTPPFEPGNGDDNDLTEPGDGWWPDAWAVPSPNNGPNMTESDAINHSDSNIDEHDYARQDWGSPGKNHATTDTWND